MPSFSNKVNWGDTFRLDNGNSLKDNELLIIDVTKIPYCWKPGIPSGMIEFLLVFIPSKRPSQLQVLIRTFFPIGLNKTRVGASDYTRVTSTLL